MIELTDLAMEFDWSLFVQGAVSQEEAVQGFEDGFSLRFIPSGRRFLSSVRFFCLYHERFSLEGDRRPADDGT